MALGPWYSGATASGVNTARGEDLHKFHQFITRMWALICAIKYDIAKLPRSSLQFLREMALEGTLSVPQGYLLPFERVYTLGPFL